VAERSTLASRATAVEAAIVRRVSGGAGPEWFGPGEPQRTVAPESVRGRPFDFPVAVNLSYQPRGESRENAISFETLRKISDPAQGGLDLLRLAIETRKDQMAAQKWCLKSRDGGDGGERARGIERLLSRPDGSTPFRTWQRALLEDLLVVDAATVYLRPGGSRPPLLDVIDGATIKRLVGADGRTPAPPDPAYQQVLHGVPAVDYTTDELVQSPRNVRPHRIYGMSPVEQVVGVVNVALRRHLGLLQYYTEGNVPEALCGVPDSWSSDQIKQFQEYWDSIFEGNLGARRHMKFLPAGMQLQFTRDPKLKDELDEWLARIVCYAFNLSPQALVREVNRATAQTSKQAAAEEGLEPIKLWFKDLLDELLEKAYGAADLEFTWRDEEIPDPQTKSAVVVNLVNAGVVKPAWIAANWYGFPTDAVPEEAPPAAVPPAEQGAGPATAPVGPDPADEDDGEPQDEPEKIAKAKKKIAPIPRNRAVVRKATKALAKSVAAVLSEQAASIADAARGKSETKDDEIGDLPASLTPAQRKALLAALEDQLELVAEDGAERALAQVGVGGVEDLLRQANAKAVAWAKSHAADLVTRIDETTRTEVQGLVERAESEGWSNGKLADAIQDAAVFDGARAETIARTETAAADVAGNVAGWRESGVVEAREWIVAQDEACEDCVLLGGQTAPIGAEFEDGDPPLHPNCRCDVLPVLQEDADED
jgi:SPP1 gp7 family putative phage head morphogenesis protein